MQLKFFLGASLFRLAAGWSSWGPKDHEWRPPGPGDSRSPCPGLNTLANHGWLPRSGKNIDLEALDSAVAGPFNYEPTTFNFVFAQVQDYNITTTGNISTFNLVDLGVHDAIEFDGSLSRNDFYFGDDLHFDPAIWATMAERLGLYQHGNSSTDKYVTVETAAKARILRSQDARKANPTFNVSSNAMHSPGTTALWLTTLWDDAVGAVPKAWIRSFFEEERIPYLEGFKRPEVQRTTDDLAAMLVRVQNVTL